MSAKSLAGCAFEPAAERSLVTDNHAPGDLAVEDRFREDLWREYRREAMNAGLSPAEADEYANALIPEMCVAAGSSNMAPPGRGWFYQSQGRVARRTIASGLITLKRWERSKTVG